MKRYIFSGSPREIGETFGEAARSEIAELYAARVANALAQAKEYGGRKVGEGTLLDLSRRCLPISETYDADGLAEMAGIARGAKMTLEQIFAMNGLTDLRDVLAFGPAPDGEGCSSFIVQRDRARDGRVIVGQSWDLATDNMPFVCTVERAVKGKPRTWSLTTSGCLSLIGLNEEGVAIGTNNLRTTDSRPGVTYLQMIHKSLGESGLAAVKRDIVDAPRAGAHFYWAADARAEAAAMECTATRAKVEDVSRGYYVHCNHFLDSAHRELEAKTPMTSSMCRQSRMAQLIAQEKEPLTPQRMMELLADHDGGINAICRHDYNGISSNGAMVIEPETRRSWVVHGPPCSGKWEQLSG